MPLWLVIIIDLLLLYFFFGEWLVDLLLPPRPRFRRRLRQLRASLRRQLRRNGDLMPAGTASAIGEAMAAIAALLADPQADAAELKRQLGHYEGEVVPKLVVARRFSTARSWMETLVVSVGVAFCIRSLLLQPFKIPTGSMQPTLFGIHYTELPADESASPNAARRLFDYLNYSRRYVEMTAPGELLVDCNDIAPLPSKPLFPRSAIAYYLTGSRQYGSFVFPGAPVDAAKALSQHLGAMDDLERRMRRGANGGLQLRLSKGERLLHGAVESGDHLFVNRMSLAFHEPRRGDVMVFSTRGITFNGQPLSGDFYIKRLVGLPGDTLKISGRALHVKPAGAASFRRLDRGDADGFGRINSGRNGYHGYSAIPQAAHLNGEDVEYTVPAGHYFMLGDNTDNSLDSRFWGSVPRENLIGLPCLVWWPFSSRFGRVDRDRGDSN